MSRTSVRVLNSPGRKNTPIGFRNCKNITNFCMQIGVENGLTVERPNTKIPKKTKNPNVYSNLKKCGFLLNTRTRKQTNPQTFEHIFN